MTPKKTLANGFNHMNLSQCKLFMYTEKDERFFLPESFLYWYISGNRRFFSFFSFRYELNNFASVKFPAGNFTGKNSL